MIRTRPVFLGLSLLLLCVLGAGALLYQQLPALIQQQVAQVLQPYGVEHIEYQPTRISGSAIRVDRLQLQGEYGDFRYQAQVNVLELHYSWRTLLNGRLRTLDISGMKLTVEQTQRRAAGKADSITLSEVLPHALLQQFPIDVLAADDWQLEYRSSTLPPLSVTGSIRIEDYLDLQLKTVIGGSEVHASLQAKTNPSRLDVNIAAENARSESLRLRAEAEQSPSANWDWNLEGRWQYAALLAWLRELQLLPATLADSLTQGATKVVAHTAITGQLQHPDRLQLEVAPGSEMRLLQQLEGRIQAATDIEQLDYPGTVNAVHGRLDMTATLRDGMVGLALQPTRVEGKLSTGLLSLPKDAQDRLGWQASIPFLLETYEPVEARFAEHGLASLNLPHSIVGLGDQDSRVDFRDLSLDVSQTGHDTTPAGDQTQLHLATRLSTAISARLKKQILPELGFVAQQRGSLEHSEFDLQLSAANDSFSTQVDGSINLSTGAGKYQLQLDSEKLPLLAESILPLLQHFKLFTQDVTLDSGRLQLTTSASSKRFTPDSWSQRSQLTLKGISGSISEYRFEKLELHAKWSGIREWRTLEPVELSLASFNPGFAIRDVKLQLSLLKATAITAPQLHLERFSADLFGGQLILPRPQRWDFGAPGNQLTVKAQHWQLADLVALQSNTAIQAQGVLEGELPLTVANGRIMIHQGYLRALPPGGHIRYTPDAATSGLAEQNPELALALELLGDFQYQVLSSDVDLDAKGNLMMGLSLSGSNPAKYEGQPINFNINLEQNLDPLLQSLRLSDTLVKQIESGLQ